MLNKEGKWLVHDPWAKWLGQACTYPAYDQSALHLRYIPTTEHLALGLLEAPDGAMMALMINMLLGFSQFRVPQRT